jgi:hypothetical protein
MYYLKKYFVANAFISPINTQTMHIKSFYTQQHCYVSPQKNLTPWWDSNMGLLVPGLDAKYNAPRRQVFFQDTVFFLGTWTFSPNFATQPTCGTMCARASRSSFPKV